MEIVSYYCFETKNELLSEMRPWFDIWRKNLPTLKEIENLQILSDIDMNGKQELLALERYLQILDYSLMLTEEIQEFVSYHQIPLPWVHH